MKTRFTLSPKCSHSLSLDYFKTDDMNLQTRGDSVGALQAVTVRSSLWTSYHKHTLNLKDEGGSLRLFTRLWSDCIHQHVCLKPLLSFSGRYFQWSSQTMRPTKTNSNSEMIPRSFRRLRVFISRHMSVSTCTVRIQALHSEPLCWRRFTVLHHHFCPMSHGEERRRHVWRRSASVLRLLFVCLFCSVASVCLRVDSCRRGTREKSHGTNRKQALRDEEEEEDEVTTRGRKQEPGISCD